MARSFTMLCTMNHAESSGNDALVLPSEQYELIVAPVLQVAAKSAATRGDPELYNDMASMLALMAQVQALAKHYLEDHPDTPAELTRAIEAAPTSVCTMALQRGELSPAQLADCIWSLQAAAKQLRTAKVLGPEIAAMAKIWKLLRSGDRPAALSALLSSTKDIVNAIDGWEQRRAE
ncbi:MAG: hypothetical protein EPN72_04065 [Nevskiaceae bacterium]|nr:MAG: hypothetical protein EPN72_04065 [Nevskiaceae bacterium]